jgi:hypothetical protein
MELYMYRRSKRSDVMNLEEMQKIKVSTKIDLVNTSLLPKIEILQYAEII